MSDAPTSPLRAILDVRREERPLAAAMFGYFFLVISTFWIMKPLKKGLFIDFYKKAGSFEIFGSSLTGSQAELVAKVLNMGVAFVAVVVFSILSKRLRRQQLTHAFTLFFVAGFGLYALTMGNPSPTIVWTFYLFGDLYSTLMVATFFVFLNDSVSSEAARRVYGPIVLGGVAGGAFGSMVLRAWVERLSGPQWMGVCAGIAIVIALLAWFAGRIVDEHPPPEVEGEKKSEGGGGNPAFEGAALVFRSKYLLAIVAVVGLYEIVSTIMDFQFTATVEHYVEETRSHFASVYLITNVVALVVQLFVTSYLMSRFKLTVALSIVPVAVLVASGSFMALPLLWFGSMLNTADNALNYSINQSSKEALYTVTTRDEKYKAKAFIDMFVMRTAKAVAVGVSLLITQTFKDPESGQIDFSSIRWLSIVTLAVAAVWLFAARYAGRRFHENERNA